MFKQEVVKGFEFVLHRKKERILLRDGVLICKVGVHFQVVAYKELTTFPSEWEVWKRLLQGVVNSQVWKSVLQVFKFQVLSSMCVKENSSKCYRISNVWKKVFQVVEFQR